jgi:5'-AMP-activated protein kinase regulatory gamma subunit
VPPPPLLSVHPLRPLYDACRFLIRTHARRLPLIDKDPQTDAEVVISVLTQYRVLKFIAMNVSRNIPAVVRAAELHLPELRLIESVPGHHAIPHCFGTGARDRHVCLRAARRRGQGQAVLPHRDGHAADNRVRRRPHVLRAGYLRSTHRRRKWQGAQPVRDGRCDCECGTFPGRGPGIALMVRTQTLVRNGAYQSLDLTIAQALKQRALDFPGVVTCSPKDSLSAVFSLIKIRRVHRLVVVAGQDDPQPGRLVGVISLSDIMRALIVSALFPIIPVLISLRPIVSLRPLAARNVERCERPLTQRLGTRSAYWWQRDRRGIRRQGTAGRSCRDGHAG